MAALDARVNIVLILCVVQGYRGTHAMNLLQVLGNWTWSDAYDLCKDLNGRMAYIEEFSARINYSDVVVEDDDPLFWTNNRTWSSVSLIPQESPPKCLALFGIAKWEFEAKLVDCNLTAETMCRAGFTTVIKEVNYSRTEARDVCRLQNNSDLVNLNLVNKKDRTQNEDIDNDQLYWTIGIVKYGVARIVEILDCIASSAVPKANYDFGQSKWNSSVHGCSKLCGNSSRIALMANKCHCLEDTFNMADFRVSGCTHACYGNSRDRCGGPSSYSVYQRKSTETPPNDDTLRDTPDLCQAVVRTAANDSRLLWKDCSNRLDGYICRNGTVDPHHVLVTNKSKSWTDALVECENKSMILASINTTSLMSDLQEEWEKLEVDTMLWVGVYSPTVEEFSRGEEIGSHDRCIAVRNFRKDPYDKLVMDCNEKLGTLCQSESGFSYDAVTTSIRSADSTVRGGGTSSVTATTGEGRTGLPEAVQTTSPHTVLSPMIIGLICTVVLVALVLTIILVILCVLLYRFKEQKRQLNMLQGPTISYSNLEHSIVISGAPSDGGIDIQQENMADMDITERLDAQFVRNDNMSVDEKSENLYEIAEDEDKKLNRKSGNGTVITVKENEDSDDRVYTEVSLTEETENPTLISNHDHVLSTNIRDSSGSRSVFSGATHHKDVSKRPSSGKATDNSNEIDCDETYDHTSSFVKKEASDFIEEENDEYDELNITLKRRSDSDNDSSTYDTVTNEEDKYDDLTLGVAKTTRTPQYEDIELNIELP